MEGMKASLNIERTSKTNHYRLARELEGTQPGTTLGSKSIAICLKICASVLMRVRQAEQQGTMVHEELQ